jgi:hypothetical protein
VFLPFWKITAPLGLEEIFITPIDGSGSTGLLETSFSHPIIKRSSAGNTIKTCFKQL